MGKTHRRRSRNSAIPSLDAVGSVLMSDFSTIDAAAATAYRDLASVPMEPDLEFWRNELAAAGRSKARQAGVLVAAELQGVDLSQLV